MVSRIISPILATSLGLSMNEKRYFSYLFHYNETFLDFTTNYQHLMKNSSSNETDDKDIVDYNSKNNSNFCVNINEFYYGTDYMTLAGVQTTFGLIYALIFILGFVGNSSVMLKVATNKKLQSARNVFLLSLMAADVLLCVTAVPVTPVGIMIKRWIFGDTMCRLIPMCQAMSVLITSFSLAAIAVDKFVHIVDCTKPPITLFQAFTVVVIIWLIAVLVNVPLVLSFKLFDGEMYLHLPEFEVAFCGQFCGEHGWDSETHRRMYGTVIMFIQFIIPMIIISFCYTRILSKVSTDMMVQNKQFSDSMSAVQKTDAVKRRRRVNYVLITMVVAFVASWLPLTMHNILHDYEAIPYFVQSQPYLSFLLCHCVAMTTVVWNPLLFFWLTRSRRSERQGFFQSILTTTMLAWNPLGSMLRKRRRQRASASKKYSVGGTTSFSDFDSYVKTEHDSDNTTWKKMSKSSLNNGSLTINTTLSYSPKRPSTLPVMKAQTDNGFLRSLDLPMENDRTTTSVITSSVHSASMNGIAHIAHKCNNVKRHSKMWYLWHFKM